MATLAIPIVFGVSFDFATGLQEKEMIDGAIAGRP
jgi:hypothetical protein